VEAFLQMKSHLVPPLKLSLRMYVRDRLDFEGERGNFLSVWVEANPQ